LIEPIDMELDWLFEKDTPTYVYALFGGVVGVLVVTIDNLFVGGARRPYRKAL
jgi:hypothetical protein